MSRSSTKMQRKPAGPANATPVPVTRSGSRFWILAAVVLLTGGGAWAFAEFVVWNKLPSDLVGKWVVEGGEQDGATFDFYRGGAMTGHINLNGREGIINARVEIADDRLLTTTRNPRTGADETRSQKIVRLSRTVLVLQDERGNTLSMVRADQ